MIEITNIDTKTARMIELTKQNCFEYNTIAERNNLSSRIKYDESSGRLLLGRIEQFEYGTHQSVLSENIDAAYDIAKAMSMQIHFEYGE